MNLVTCQSKVISNSYIDLKMVVVLKSNGQSTMLGLSSEIHPSKVGMIKKQHQDDDKVSIFSSVNTHSHHRVINFKDDSCFLCNNPAASGPEVYIMLHYTSSMLKYVNNYVIALNKTVLLAKL